LKHGFVSQQKRRNSASGYSLPHNPNWLDIWGFVQSEEINNYSGVSFCSLLAPDFYILKKIF
jgi:hypothetical protein